MTYHAPDSSGVVSVVVVNYRGAPDTITCLRQLAELDFPAERLELICVDNASGDDSVEAIRANMPAGTLLIEAPRNGGFTGGCNLGAESATGEFLAFINNDARPDPQWLTEAVAALALDSTIGCVASKVLDWDGVAVDFVDAAFTWFGMGYKPGAGAPYDGTHEQPKDVLFPTGSAMVLRTAVFDELGGFDERFFMFYEDVDLGWRLNLKGYRVRYVPSSLVYHKHHASMKNFGEYSEWFLLERNSLMTLYKNVSDEALGRLLAPAMALAIRRSLALGDADTAVLDLEQGLGGDSAESTTVTKRSLTGAYAIDSFVDRLPSLAASRREIQAQRTRSDRELSPLLRNAIEPAIPNPRYLDGHQSLVDAFEIVKWFSSRQRILVITADPLTARMAGPAIRAFHIAEGLAAANDVRLISTTLCAIESDDFSCRARTPGQLRPEVAWADVVIFQGFLLTQAPWLARTDKILVPDLYDPMHLEQLEQTRGAESTTRTRDIVSTTEALNLQLRRGDFFLCASEKQRHFWLGELAAVGRLNPKTYDRDPSLKNLLAVVPFGLPNTAPTQQFSPIKGGGVPGISASDKVLLWAGGIYNWFDPLTLLRAVGRLSERHPDIRLYFLGTQHPNPLVPRMRMVSQTRALADAMGLTDKFVFFNEGWVPYDDRHNYLLDADLGVSTHFEHIETTFSFRTRILDYLWAGLPMVVTEGDSFGDLVTRRGLGVAVPEQDLDALVTALEVCLYDADFVAECRANTVEAAREFTWPVVLRPLSDFCEAPRRASDAAGPSSPLSGFGAPTAMANVRGDIALAREYLREGGVGELARRAAGRLRGKAAGRLGRKAAGA
ncbi:MAG: glycosyltransferase [Actinomycetota bacterium]|nr:glycosyltransferase [Actinomycetota bacterium]